MDRIRLRLRELAVEQANLERRFKELSTPKAPTKNQVAAAHLRDRALTPADKIALFRRLFAGRTDVFPLRWENPRDGRSGYAPACANEWKRGICGKPQVKCGECPNQAFIPLSAEIVDAHLRGHHPTRPPGAEFIAGVYPLLHDETCWFVAVDFDGIDWVNDARAYVHACAAHGVQAALERSRSGNGAHAWIFFAEAVLARDARKLAAWFITVTMESRPEIGFESYDRLFPSQDTMPAGGFGNLIALPLQRRARDQGNTVFIDADLNPYADQWAFLASLQRVDAGTLYRLLDDADARGGALGVRIPAEDEESETPWRAPSSRRINPTPIREPLPRSVRIVVADEVYVDHSELPPSMVARLTRLAAFQNPEFYRAQAMRLPTFGKPRVISCASLHARHIGLPRGCLDEVRTLLAQHKVECVLEDRRESGSPLSVRFTGTLRRDQDAAVSAMAAHDFGVLSATTAFGKTVVAAAMIALRGCNTLVLVHRRELLQQWGERLQEFLSLTGKEIGYIGGGKRKPTGRVDIAIIQSLVRKGEVSDLIAGYGQLIVDECHHLSASSFELVARRSKAKYVLGLSATVTRKDGHHPIIFMQCGPVRHRVDARSQATRRAIDHCVHIRRTKFQFEQADGQRISMAEIYAALATDADRNALIFDDVLTALEHGRCPLVLTERRDHLEWLQEKFSRFARNVVVFKGGMTERARKDAKAMLEQSAAKERLVLSTGKYLGEGFDDARLDTLFLTMPISWKGTLAQYVGRLHRTHHDKSDVIVYDYVDSSVRVLARMAARRQAGYRALGYVIS
ncbi:MAG TPA: DEAD/DEAH box helicase family protein [Steroidobacteraceae bacterium]|nr:DEAD/DEAH box helicase family protein [Steroidobacteraceae bacterium]